MFVLRSAALMLMVTRFHVLNSRGEIEAERDIPGLI